MTAGLIRCYVVPHPQRYQPDTVRCGRLAIKARTGSYYELARRLLDLGVRPETILQLHAVSGTQSLTMTVGVAAGWQVVESDRGGLYRRSYQEHPFSTRRPLESFRGAQDARNEGGG